MEELIRMYKRIQVISVQEKTAVEYREELLRMMGRRVDELITEAEELLEVKERLDVLAGIEDSR